MLCEQTGPSSACLVKPGNELLSAITRCVSVARGTLCPMTAINALGATLRQHKRAGPYILFESSHIPFSPFSVSYLASPPSSEWIQPSGCWQAALFFSFKGNVLRDLDRLLFSLTSDEGGMAAGRGNCSSEIVSRMCGGQTCLCSPMLELVQNIAGKKTDAMC